MKLPTMTQVDQFFAKTGGLENVDRAAIDQWLAQEHGYEVADFVHDVLFHCIEYMESGDRKADEEIDRLLKEVQELEETVEEAEGEIQRLDREVDHLRDVIGALEYDLAKARGENERSDD